MQIHKSLEEEKVPNDLSDGTRQATDSGGGSSVLGGSADLMKHYSRRRTLRKIGTEPAQKSAAESTISGDAENIKPSKSPTTTNTCSELLKNLF